MNEQTSPARRIAFADPGLPGAMTADVAAALVAAAGDLAVILDAGGIVHDVAGSEADLAALGFTDWAGRAWADTVTIESRPKIAELLAAEPGDAMRWRQVNHPAAGGDVPLRYIVIALGRGERLIAIGRDMRAQAAVQQRLLQTQQSLERDYIRLRQVEMRYRLLFDMAAEPVLIVDAETRRIREANPSAHRLLDAADGALIGQPADVIVEASDRDVFVAHLGAAEAADDVAPVALHLGGGHGAANVSARLFRQARASLLLVRIAPAGAAAAGHRHDAALGDVVERMPDAFVLAGRDLEVLTANAAFVELAEAASIERVIGAPLANWVGRPGIDLELIVAQLREHGAVRNVSTVLRGGAGGHEEVELSAVLAPTGEGECFGFTIRAVGRRMRGAPVIAPGVPRSVEQLTGLVGRMSLKEIVRESTDLIERLCIEAALAYTSDNRASAAEVLGVSRQSLYSKLHRHGLGNLVPGDD